jgi:MFS family permease
MAHDEAVQEGQPKKKGPYYGWVIVGIAALLLGTAFMFMGFVDQLWQHFVLQILIRSITAGTFFMVVGIVVPKWFVVKRGRAMALSAMRGRLGQFLNPVIVGTVIITRGWRYAWPTMGLIVWIVAVIPVYFFFKASPESMGLLPDGIAEEEAARLRETEQRTGLRQRGISETSMGPKEALRTRAFYLMLLAQTALALVISGLHFHWFAYMTGQGLSDEVAVASISISSLAGIPVSLFAGLLAERV